MKTTELNNFVHVLCAVLCSLLLGSGPCALLLFKSRSDGVIVACTFVYPTLNKRATGLIKIVLAVIVHYKFLKQFFGLVPLNDVNQSCIESIATLCKIDDRATDSMFCKYIKCSYILILSTHRLRTIVYGFG